MADATESLVGRSVGHEWAVFVATSGHFCWPPTGSSDWPLTDRFSDKQKDAAARHNHAMIDTYVQEIRSAAPNKRRAVWHGRVRDAVVAHEATAALVGRPWNAPDDITAWSEG